MKINNLISFLVGGAVGAGVSWVILKRYYDDISREKIESVKSVYKKKYEDKEPDEEEPQKDYEKPDLKEYAKMVQENSYSEENKEDYENAEKAMRDFTEAIQKKNIKLISLDAFGEEENYGKETLYLYSDGVLADENDMIADIDQICGQDAFGHFGDYEDDALFVRNDRLKCDYEILKDYRTYEEVSERSAHQR